MNWQHTPYTLPLLIAAGIGAVLALYSWRRRLGAGATPFVVLMLALVVWSVGYALELAAVDVAHKVFWAKVQYLGIITIPVAWLAFALQYTGRAAWLTRSRLAALIGVPALTFLSVWTNNLHGLVWRSVAVDTSGLFSVLDLTHGPSFWLHVVYSYILLLSGTVLLVQGLIRSRGLYRGQTVVLLIGLLAPWIGNFLYVTGLSPFPHLDLTPFGYAVTGLVVIWGLFRFRLLDIVPVARDAVVAGMVDGVIVLDGQDRIVDINRAAVQIIGGSISDVPGQPDLTGQPDLIGQPVGRLLADWPDLISRYGDVQEAREEIILGEGSAQRTYELRILPMRDRQDHTIGRMVILHDSTDRKQAETALLAQQRLFEGLVAVARAAAERFTLRDTLQNVLDVAVSLTEAEHGSLFLLSETDLVTHAILARGRVTAAQEQEIVDRVMAKGLSGWVARNQQSALIRDTSEDTRWLDLPDAPYTARSALVVPIISRGAVLGVLTLTHPERDHFTIEYLELMRAAADQMALALRNAQIYDAQRRLANRQATLYEGLRAVGAYLNPDAALRVAVVVVARMTGWPAVAVLLPEETVGTEPTHLVVRATAGSLSISEGLQIPIERTITGRAFETKETQNVPDVAVDPDYLPGKPEIRSELAVLLRRGERVLGVLDVESDRRNGFDGGDIQLAESLGEAIALALDNARLFQEVADGRGRLQTLIESSRDGIVLVGMDGNVPVVNAPALELLGMPDEPEEWIDQPIQGRLMALRHHAPRVVRTVLAELRRIRQGKEPTEEGEFEVGARTVHWLSLPVLSSAAPLGRLIVLRDVTEERLLERMRDDLTHTMVHDLRNPLTSISASLSFLDDVVGESLPSNMQQILDIAQSSTWSMLDLVNAILDISRLESGRMPLERTDVLIENLIAGVLDAQMPVAMENDLHLESDIPPDLPLTWVDGRLIERVLQNLVGNAVKFTPSGGVVRVTVEKIGSDTEPQILVAVRDSGPGIPFEIQDRLFEKFVTGMQEGRGSGLGLAFCKMVVEAHGERIWVESIPGKGATFFLTLPVLPESPVYP